MKLPQKKIIEQIKKDSDDILMLVDTEKFKKQKEGVEKLQMLAQLGKVHHVKLSEELLKITGKMKVKCKIKTIILIE